MGNHTADHDRAGLEPPASMAELRGDCARTTSRRRAPGGRDAPPPPAAPPLPGRIDVPPGSAALLAGMSDYGG